MPKRQKTDEALDAFIQILDSWDGQKPSFQELIVMTAERCADIAERTGDGTAFVAEFAALTNWPESSIRGWMRGRNLPNDRLARTLSVDLRIFLQKKIAGVNPATN